MRKLNYYKYSIATFMVRNTSFDDGTFVFGIKRVVFLILVSHIIQLSVVAQTIQSKIETAKELISDANYNQAYNTLQDITDGQVEKFGNAYVASFNYLKGSCLYYLNKYEDAIPFLQEGIQVMEKLPNKSCEYLEMIYGIGSCYKKMGAYQKAEDYFRKTILKGTYLDLNCTIRTQTYSEMAELYMLMGKPNFADICTSRIESEMGVKGSKELDAQIDVLWNLYKAHETQGKIDEYIIDLKKLRHLVEENKGKNNKDYLAYSFLLGGHLRYNCNRPQEAAIIHKEMIDIGKEFKTYCHEVCCAYVYYLRYLSESNKVDSIELILPSAIKYYNETMDKRGEEENLYEIVGNGLCDAQNFEEGIKYLEREWKGDSANSIKALGHLTYYYFDLKDNPNKALLYAKKAEDQINGGQIVTDRTKINILQFLIEINQRLGNDQESDRYSQIIEPLINKQEDTNNLYIRYLISWSTECIGSSNNEKAIKLVKRIDSFINEATIDYKIRAYLQKGFVYIKVGRYDESLENSAKGIQLAISEKGEKYEALATLYHNLGRAYMLKGNYYQALSNLNQSKVLQMELYGNVWQNTNDYIKECESR